MRALIVVDVQNDFMPKHWYSEGGVRARKIYHQGGTLPVENGNFVVERINEAMRDFELVILTQDWHPETHCSFMQYGGLHPIHCVQNSWGAQFHPLLDTTKAILTVRKGFRVSVDSYSGMKENVNKAGVRLPTGLEGALHNLGVYEVYCGGLAEDFCVGETARDAAKAGFKSFIIRDLTYPVFPEKVAAYRNSLVADNVTYI